jgi:hypothetical protein
MQGKENGCRVHYVYVIGHDNSNDGIPKTYSTPLLVQSTIATNNQISIAPFRWCCRLHPGHQNRCVLLAILHKTLAWIDLADLNPYRSLRIR